MNPIKPLDPIYPEIMKNPPTRPRSLFLLGSLQKALEHVLLAQEGQIQVNRETHSVVMEEYQVAITENPLNARAGARPDNFADLFSSPREHHVFNTTFKPKNNMP